MKKQELPLSKALELLRKQNPSNASVFYISTIVKDEWKRKEFDKMTKEWISISKSKDILLISVPIGSSSN